jgi:RNA methyltransferase, TrmH family
VPEPLTSTRNPRVRAAAALRRRRERTATGRHLVEGPKAVGEALAAGIVREVLVTAARRTDLEVPDGVAVVTVADHVLEHIADAATPQGVVAVAETPVVPRSVLAESRFVVVLDGLADPGNVGTVIRTADAAGADAVVATTGSADPYGPKAVRAAVGSTYHLPVVVDVTMAAVVSLLRGSGHQVLGLDAAGPRSVFDLTRDDAPLALVLGSEAHGLSAPGDLDGTLAVPIAGRAESLNAAAAAAVAAFAVREALRGGLREDQDG